MILMSDYYKQSHAEQYPKGITKLISYATARMSRMPDNMYGDKLTVFGIQSYVKDFLIERFNETFFDVPVEEAMEFYKEVIGETFPIQYVDTHKFEKLHELGYLPVEVSCLPEGTRVPIRNAFTLPEGQCQVPFMSIVNTHPDFPWVTEFLESVTSSEIWYPMAIANQAYLYRQIVNEWFDKTGCDANARKSAISEFGFRGGKGSGAATLASAAFLTSFNKSATIPAICYLNKYYNEPIKGGNIGSGMISTEHSVMCSNFAVDSENYPVVEAPYNQYSAGDLVRVNDERFKNDIFEVVRELTTSDEEKYNIKNVSSVISNAEYGIVNDEGELTGEVVVVDAATKLLLKKVDNIESVFLKRLFTKIYPGGALSVVMDSYDYWANLLRCGEGELKEAIMARNGAVFFRGDSGDPVDIICGEPEVRFKDLDHRLMSRDTCKVFYSEDEKCWYKLTKENYTDHWVKCEEKPVEVMGTVELLWNMFGGTENAAGYKVLDSHVRAIYGDSITPRRAKLIYGRLAEKGFAACNVALGAGSFSTQCAESDDGRLLPFTRDTYGIAVKATWCANENTGKEYQLFKNPKTDTGKFKKSQKGLIYVTKDENGEIIAYDNYDSKTLPAEGNLLQPIFRDGKMLKEVNLTEVRNRLHEGDF